jgi:hypothetical protein
VDPLTVVEPALPPGANLLVGPLLDVRELESPSDPPHLERCLVDHGTSMTSLCDPGVSVALPADDMQSTPGSLRGRCNAGARLFRPSGSPNHTWRNGHRRANRGWKCVGTACARRTQAESWLVTSSSSRTAPGVAVGPDAFGDPKMQTAFNGFHARMHVGPANTALDHSHNPVDNKGGGC